MLWDGLDIAADVGAVVAIVAVTIIVPPVESEEIDSVGKVVESGDFVVLLLESLVADDTLGVVARVEVVAVSEETDNVGGTLVIVPTVVQPGTSIFSAFFMVQQSMETLSPSQHQLPSLQ